MKPISIKIKTLRGAWVAQFFEHLTLAQVMISQFRGSSLAWGSVLTAQSLNPASHSSSPLLSAPPPLILCLSLKTNKHEKDLKKNKGGIHHSALSTAGTWEGGSILTDFSSFKMLPQTVLKPNMSVDHQLQLLVSMSDFLCLCP